MTEHLPPGPDLDLMVARAMLTDDGDAYIENRPDHMPNGKPVCYVCWELEGDSFDEWSPSTDIRDAWVVMEHMRCLQLRPSDLDKWLCCRNEDGDWDCCAWYSVAPTAPLAICYAALQALAGDKP